MPSAWLPRLVFPVPRVGRPVRNSPPRPMRLLCALLLAVAGATAALVLVAGALWWTFERRTEAIRTALQRRLLR